MSELDKPTEWKLAFREDNDRGLVVCFLSPLDDSHRLELASISKPLLESCSREIYLQWIELMKRAFESLASKGRLSIKSWRHFGPSKKN
jgi:hypothetical protein